LGCGNPCADLWYGDNMGPGHFYNSHGLAIDPTNGDVWIGDREEFRIVIYTGRWAIQEDPIDAESRLRAAL
jgi:hypothetical protein